MAERRWVSDIIGHSALEQLACGLTGSQLQSLLLEVMQRRAHGRTPAQLLDQYQRDPLCRPASVDLRTSLALDQQLLAATSAFESIELSPLAPLGACSAVALTDQHRVLSALRSCEVTSDPTNLMALECAKRLRAQPPRPGRPIHLATSQRIVRAQPVPKLPGYAQHFRLFALASAGRETAQHGFTADSVVLHIRSMLAAVDRLQQCGYAFGERRIVILSTPPRAALARHVGDAFGGAVTYEPLQHAYYSGGLRYQIWLTLPDGSESLPVIDGGVFDWLAKLTSNQRAVFVASGAGSQLIALRFVAQ